MIDSIFVRLGAVIKHREAPLLKEREEYLRHLAVAEEKHQKSLQPIAMVLIHIIRVMNMTSLRQVDMPEIRLAAERWARETIPHRIKLGGRTSAPRFIRTARSWFRFHGSLIVPAQPSCRFDSALEEFTHAMRYEMELAPNTIQGSFLRARQFLYWMATRRDSLSSICLQDVDEYLTSRQKSGMRPQTLAGDCNVLRRLFRYAERRGWCKPNLARGIRNPNVRTYDSSVAGPSWRDVRRLIKASGGSSLADCRAKAILLLCSIYALRNGEVTRLLLNDFDWHNETFNVKRGKRGKTQQFPLQYEVGEAIIRYLRNARPPCSCRNLFVTLFAPYRPLKSTWSIISSRMRKLGIKSQNSGPHSLRHACATELLRVGTSLKDIADFLGHRDIASVSIYAKYDARTIREVAAFSLDGVR